MNPEFPGQNAHVLPGLHPAQGLKLELPQEGELLTLGVRSNVMGSSHVTG